MHSSSRLRGQPFTGCRSIRTSMSFHARLTVLSFACVSNGLTIKWGDRLMSICQANYLYVLYKNLDMQISSNQQNWQTLMNRYFTRTCSGRLSYVYFLFSFDLKAVQKCQYKFSVSWTCVIFLWYLLISQLQQNKLVKLKSIPIIISKYLVFESEIISVIKSRQRGNLNHSFMFSE